ncbi:MAG: YggS family pyridoxal phosphate-dependent enzyme [Pseudomonadota bacterium]
MTAEQPDIRGNLAAVRKRIHAAAIASGRTPEHIRLLAVSKYMPEAYIKTAMAAGQHVFGENTVQDALKKLPLLRDPANEWHFIGHLQSNKAKHIPEKFSWFHTLDSLKLANRLAQQCRLHDTELNVLVQINISSDPDKHGLAVAGVDGFIDSLLNGNYTGLSLCGLMTIGQRTASLPERQREFAALRELSGTCATRFGKQHFTELSMGMSNDFELAIQEGATIVRVGSAIFGARPRRPA